MTGIYRVTSLNLLNENCIEYTYRELTVEELNEKELAQYNAEQEQLRRRREQERREAERRELEKRAKLELEKSRKRHLRFLHICSGTLPFVKVPCPTDPFSKRDIRDKCTIYARELHMTVKKVYGESHFSVRF